MNFWNYITGSRKGKEARRVELEAMCDPFLSDAIEGYDLVKDEDHAARIEAMSRRVRRRKPQRFSLVKTISIAASLLLCVGLGGYFLLRDGSPLIQESRMAYSLDVPPAPQQYEADALSKEMTAHTLTVPEPIPQEAPAVKGNPQPATGKEAYKEYVEENLFLPAFDECGNARGNVVVAFKVNAKGRPYDLDVQKSLCPTADLEALRVVEEGPNWTLGDKIVKLTIRF